MESSRDVETLYKMVLLGDAETGKSSLMPNGKPFNSGYVSTIGVEFAVHRVEVGDKKVKLQVWDAAGQRHFMDSARIYVLGAHAVVLTYDLTKKESFTNLTKWLGIARKVAGKDCLIYLVGTKEDKENERKVTTEEALAFADQEKLIYCAPMSVTDKQAGQNTPRMQAFYEKIAKDAYVKFGPNALAAPKKREEVKPSVAPKQEDAKSSVAPPSNLQLSFSKRRKTASIVTGIVAGVAVALALSLLAYFFWPVIVTMGFIVAGAAALGINLTATAILGTVLGGLGAAGLFGTGVGFFTNFMYPKVASRLGATSQSESSSKPRRDSIPLMPVGTPSTNPQPGSQPSAQLDPAAPQSQQNAEPYVAGSPRV